MKRIALLIFSLFFVILYVGAAISLTAKAPGQVAVGEQFRLQYTINATGVDAPPHISSINGFSILYGPATSTSQSVQIINGHTTKNASTSYTFTLVAEAEGTFTLPSVTLSVDGRSYTSNKPRIQVTKGGASSRTGQSSSSNGQLSQSQSKSVSHSLNPSDLYIEVSASKREVYEQEPVLLSYNVYTNLMLEQLQGKMPDLKGFVAKEIELPRTKQLSVTRHNGHMTQTTTWSQYVMFPQQSGRLTVPSIPFEGVVVYPNHNVDPIDAFFFGSSAVQRVNHTVNAPKCEITVKPLPDKPEGFTGAVGHGFTASAHLATKDVRENETLSLILKIKGVGNIDLISEPEVEFPADFEKLNSKSTVDAKLTTQGLEGELQIEYLAIPNHEGKFQIPPIRFIYFDPADATYHTVLSGEPITINVAKGNPNSYAARQRMKNDDIRHIHFAEPKASSAETFWLSLVYWLMYLLVVVGFVVANRVMTGRLSRQNDVKGNLFRKASSKASARLKAAKEAMERKDSQAFFQLALSALQDFVADKTALAQSAISKESIPQLFKDSGVDDSLTERYLQVLDELELHIYGVSQASDDLMQRLYDSALGLISELNPKLKKKK